MSLLLQQRNRWEQGTRKNEVEELTTKNSEYQFGWAVLEVQFSFYAVKVLSTLDCYIILRLHNIDGQSTVPQLCSYLDGKALFLERPTAVVYSSMPSFLPKQHSTFKPLFYRLASKVNHMEGLFCMLFSVRYSIFCQLEQMVRQKTFHRQRYSAFIHKSFWQQNTLASQSPYYS